MTINFTFTSPLGTMETVRATATVTTGSVSDVEVDYGLGWGTILVDFGIGGQFELSLLDLSFTGASILTQTATIKLLALPETVVTAVPEPATLALFGLGPPCWRAAGGFDRGGALVWAGRRRTWPAPDLPGLGAPQPF